MTACICSTLSRRLIVEHKFLLGDDRVPAFCALSRLQLHEILLGAAERAGVQVRLGVTVSEIHDDKDRVDVRFSTGERDSFDLLAGFDGIRSTTRLHLVGTAFAPRPSGYGAWRVQAPRPDDVRGMEFLQGIGSKTGAMPLSNDIMYLFHIRPEAAGRQISPDRIWRSLFKERLAQYGSYVAEIAASLDSRLRHRLQPDRAADAALAVVPRTGRHRRRRRAYLCAASDARRRHGGRRRLRAGARGA